MLCTAEQGLLHSIPGHDNSRLRLRSSESRNPFQRCLSVLCKLFSSGGRTRTDDLQVMSLASYQLLLPRNVFVDPEGFEPSSSPMLQRTYSQAYSVVRTLTNFLLESFWTDVLALVSEPTVSVDLNGYWLAPQGSTRFRKRILRTLFLRRVLRLGVQLSFMLGSCRPVLKLPLKLAQQTR
jgi:hypothetical protein